MSEYKSDSCSRKCITVEEAEISAALFKLAYDGVLKGKSSIEEAKDEIRERIKKFMDVEYRCGKYKSRIVSLFPCDKKVVTINLLYKLCKEKECRSRRRSNSCDGKKDNDQDSDRSRKDSDREWHEDRKNSCRDERKKDHKCDSDGEYCIGLSVTFIPAIDCYKKCEILTNGETVIAKNRPDVRNRAENALYLFDCGDRHGKCRREEIYDEVAVICCNTGKQFTFFGDACIDYEDLCEKCCDSDRRRKSTGRKSRSCSPHGRKSRSRSRSKSKSRSRSRSKSKSHSRRRSKFRSCSPQRSCSLHSHGKRSVSLSPRRHRSASFSPRMCHSGPPSPCPSPPCSPLSSLYFSDSDDDCRKKPRRGKNRRRKKRDKRDKRGKCDKHDECCDECCDGDFYRRDKYDPCKEKSNRDGYFKDDCKDKKRNRHDSERDNKYKPDYEPKFVYCAYDDKKDDHRGYDSCDKKDDHRGYDSCDKKDDHRGYGGYQNPGYGGYQEHGYGQQSYDHSGYGKPKSHHQLASIRHQGYRYGTDDQQRDGESHEEYCLRYYRRQGEH